MKTQKHAEKLGARRAEYGDKRVSNQIDRLAIEIQASRGVSMGEARQAALRKMIERAKQ